MKSAKAMKILVSACLLGEKVRYDGQSKETEGIMELAKKHELYRFCPEVSGGLPVPRRAAELKGSSVLILGGGGGVIDSQGNDVTDAFRKGAENALKFCLDHGIRAAVLKEKSPSCGLRAVYDGSFSGKLIEGTGVTTELLQQNGIAVYTEENFQELLKET